MEPSKQVDPRKIEQWNPFVEQLQKGHQKADTFPQPFAPVIRLVQKYLQTGENLGCALDIGCETGKNAVPLIEAGYKVTILDVSPKALHYTRENLKERGLEEGIEESVHGEIEKLDLKYGPFDAVVSTYVFPFIPANLFNKVLEENVLGRIKPAGYFAGAFFGEEHAWGKDPSINTTTVEKVNSLFTGMNFDILEIQEKKEDVQTVFGGKQLFHTIEVIARRNLE